jgi:hypothetical protein
MRSALLVGLSLLSSNVAAGDCAMVEFYPNLITPASTNIGDKGGVVVAQLAFANRPKTAATTWRFSGAKVAPKVISIAPGLDVYQPAATGKLELTDGDGKAMIAVSASGKRAELAAPTVTALKFHENRGRHSSATTIAELSGDPPDGAVALVVFDKDGKARSFGTVVRNAKSVTVYSQSDCGGPFKGTIVSRTGDQVKVAWLDAGGVLSKQSAVLRVK